MVGMKSKCLAWNWLHLAKRYTVRYNLTYLTIATGITLRILLNVCHQLTQEDQQLPQASHQPDLTASRKISIPRQKTAQPKIWLKIKTVLCKEFMEQKRSHLSRIKKGIHIKSKHPAKLCSAKVPTWRICQKHRRFRLVKSTSMHAAIFTANK